MPKEKHGGLRTWIEIDTKAVAHNYRVFRALIAKRTRLMAVVKSNAYGHNLLEFSKEMERLGADFLGVDSVVEALALRKEGVRTPILVLGYTVREMIAAASEADIALTVSSFETLSHIARAKFAKPLSVHIKADTGMHRQGFLLPQQKALLAKIKSQKSKIRVEGLYTHFAAAKNPAFPHDTRRQIALFRGWIRAFRTAGMRPIVHAAATSGVMLFPESHFDMVRVGIGLYGLWPAKEVEESLKGRIALRPILTWKTNIGEIKKVPALERVGYDLTEALQKNSTIAVCPIGYWHGYPRALSSIGRVLVKGKAAKVLGRVSMDMIVIDISGIANVRVEDEVTLIDAKGVADVTAERLGFLTDTSHYEIVTRLNPLIKRFYS